MVIRPRHDGEGSSKSREQAESRAKEGSERMKEEAGGRRRRQSKASGGEVTQGELSFDRQRYEEEAGKVGLLTEPPGCWPGEGPGYA